MINIQGKIEKILNNTHIDKLGKVERLHSLLNDSKCDFLVDFDDTISDNKCLLYSKYNYLKSRHKINEDKLTDDFVINKKFVSFFHDKGESSIIILSANNLYFLKKIIKKYKNLFSEIGIKILGIVGTSEFLKVDLETKKEIIPRGKPYVSDIMEFQRFKRKDNYVCLDNYSWFNYIGVICKKICYYLLFIFKNV